MNSFVLRIQDIMSDCESSRYLAARWMWAIFMNKHIHHSLCCILHTIPKRNDMICSFHYANNTSFPNLSFEPNSHSRFDKHTTLNDFHRFVCVSFHEMFCAFSFGLFWVLTSISIQQIKIFPNVNLVSPWGIRAERSWKKIQ